MIKLAAPAQGRPAAIVFVFITVMIDMIAMGVTAPVLPTLIQKMAGSPPRPAG